MIVFCYLSVKDITFAIYLQFKQLNGGLIRKYVDRETGFVPVFSTAFISKSQSWQWISVTIRLSIKFKTLISAISAIVM